MFIYKAVYIGPLKALTRERVLDWKKKFENTLKYTVTELTGDSAPDSRALVSSDILITTPEKWDGTQFNI
jgi:replicative superfamily II helicase